MRRPIETRRQDSILQVRMFNDELQILKQAAERENKTVSDYVREKLLIAQQTEVKVSISSQQIPRFEQSAGEIECVNPDTQPLIPPEETSSKRRRNETIPAMKFAKDKWRKRK